MRYCDCGSCLDYASDEVSKCFSCRGNATIPPEEGVYRLEWLPLFETEVRDSWCACGAPATRGVKIRSSLQREAFACNVCDDIECVVPPNQWYKAYNGNKGVEFKHMWCAMRKAARATLVNHSGGSISIHGGKA